MATRIFRYYKGYRIEDCRAEAEDAQDKPNYHYLKQLLQDIELYTGEANQPSVNDAWETGKNKRKS